MVSSDQRQRAKAQREAVNSPRSTFAHHETHRNNSQCDRHRGAHSASSAHVAAAPEAPHTHPPQPRVSRETSAPTDRTNVSRPLNVRQEVTRAGRHRGSGKPPLAWLAKSRFADTAHPAPPGDRTRTGLHGIHSADDAGAVSRRLLRLTIVRPESAQRPCGVAETRNRAHRTARPAPGDGATHQTASTPIEPHDDGPADIDDDVSAEMLRDTCDPDAPAPDPGAPGSLTGSSRHHRRRARPAHRRRSARPVAGGRPSPCLTPIDGYLPHTRGCGPDTHRRRSSGLVVRALTPAPHASGQQTGGGSTRTFEPVAA